MKPILNYFVPFTNGKFVANCLMFSSDVYGTANEMASNSDWTANEYSDVDVWWKDYEHDWFNTNNWIDYIRPEVPRNQYVFYTCHEDYTVDYIKQLLPQSRIVCIVPDLELCRKNYQKKNWIEDETDFETSRVYREFQSFNAITTDLVIQQQDLFQVDSFVKSIDCLAQGLNITLDMAQVLKYRSRYFSHPMNQI